MLQDSCGMVKDNDPSLFAVKRGRVISNSTAMLQDSCGMVKDNDPSLFAVKRGRVAEANLKDQPGSPKKRRR
jgi:hypothetical protein